MSTQTEQELPELIESHADGVATLTMNRPHARNAMGGTMMDLMHAALPRLALDKSVRCLVLTGAGGAFCAGGDVKGFASSAAAASPDSNTGFDMESRSDSLRQGMELSKLLHTMAKPTLAAISGPAAGAGLSLALACDMRIALDTAKLTTAFAKVGLSGDYGVSFFLPYLLGQAKARELLFTASVLSGTEAHAIGLVNQVASADDFAEVVATQAKQLAALPTVALGYMKKNLNTAYTGSLSDALDRESHHMARCFMTEDHKGAVQAFVAKTAPEFKGR
ncbi:MAG TPA: enoyl-CoA hydratase [Gammaproteobacteria bacterium]|nr:enoyl-CoA hydratase [Gammaproteobacteria bacterium]|tara:strand:+ start:31 stop:864 length:834 start_codon:yes stop_codon:yes gene_type:complete